MKQTLFTNNMALTGHNFKNEFKTQLNSASDLIIASGYFGASSIVEHQNDILKLGERGVCKILIGMIFHGGVTGKQREVLVALDKNLRAKNPDNGVYISIKDYHGKIYYFRNNFDKKESLYLGSSNFSEEGFASRHECTALIEHEKTKNDVADYLEHLFDEKIAKPLNKVELRLKGRTAFIAPSSKLLEDYEIPLTKFPNISNPIGICEIELRVDDQPNSSLNLYFEKGRVNPKTKLYAPRPWYEVEITSCKKDRDNPFYPKSLSNSTTSKSRKGEFIAYAKDNGKYYKFDMAVYSDDGKAISTSEKSGGRTTLGKFIKGKLERAGLLEEGERITSDMLLEYGNSSIKFIKFSDNVYVIEF
jgi:hypothetical protein